MGKVIESHHDLDTIERICIGELSKGVNKKSHPFREVTMATAAGSPNVRTVILRELRQEPLSVLVYTDNRSEKISELGQSPYASFLFWHKASKFQLKLRTLVKIHRNDQLANVAWDSLSSKGKESYNTSLPPSERLKAEKNPSMPLRENYVADDFCMLECRVFEMEALQLRREGHIRARYSIDKGESSFIVP
jgi:hypothetical protein